MVDKATVRALFNSGELDLCNAAAIARALRKEGHTINQRVEDEFSYVHDWCNQPDPPKERKAVIRGSKESLNLFLSSLPAPARKDYHFEWDSSLRKYFLVFSA